MNCKMGNDENVNKKYLMELKIHIYYAYFHVTFSYVSLNGCGRVSKGLPRTTISRSSTFTKSLQRRFKSVMIGLKTYKEW